MKASFEAFKVKHSEDCLRTEYSLPDALQGSRSRQQEIDDEADDEIAHAFANGLMDLGHLSAGESPPSSPVLDPAAASTADGVAHPGVDLLGRGEILELSKTGCCPLPIVILKGLSTAEYDGYTAMVLSKPPSNGCLTVQLPGVAGKQLVVKLEDMEVVTAPVKEGSGRSIAEYIERCQMGVVSRRSPVPALTSRSYTGTLRESSGGTLHTF
jgi:hypothetical protein